MDRTSFARLQNILEIKILIHNVTETVPIVQLIQFIALYIPVGANHGIASFFLRFNRDPKPLVVFNFVMSWWFKFLLFTIVGVIIVEDIELI